MRRARDPEWMRALPRGTVTFLFSDVEGSTALLARLGAVAYALELERHRAFLRGACAAHGGVEVDVQGDSLFVAFACAGDAVAAALAGQALLADGPVRVRMGLHTGEPLVTASGYVGMDVHRAARIAAAAHGGQVLLSQATCVLVPQAEVLDLGEHRLKDLTRPERLYQAGVGAFPPPRSLNRTNLPIAAHPLVDRTVEQLELAELVRSQRVVTITGAGGIGKTRLALQVAAELIDEFVDGVFFVPFAGTRDPTLVVPAARQALGLRDDEPPLTRRALLVLDNLEHLSTASTDLAQLLAEAPELKLLVTSRTPLRLSVEREYPLDPLPENAAVELFLDRARAVRRDVEPAAVVAQICRRVDGLPLALELAAARLKVLTPATLLERLEERLPLLTRGPRDLPERQQTLEATIAWSYDLLEATDRALFTRLSTFAGGFDLEAAETVADADVDTLAALVDASLVKPLGDGRFLCLETIREFARARLEEPMRSAVRRRHAHYFSALAKRAEPHLTGPQAPAWLTRLERNHANLGTALEWLMDADPERATRLTTDLWRYWFVRGHLHEAAAQIKRALALQPAEAERALLRYQLGAILVSRGEPATARPLFEAALGGFRAVGDQDGEARALAAIGHAATDACEWETARGLYEQAAAIRRRLNDPIGLGAVLGDFAALLLRSGHPAEAISPAIESIELHQGLGNGLGEALSLANLGYALLATGDLPGATNRLGESARLCRDLGYAHGLVFALNGLALLACAENDQGRAATAFGAAQKLRRAVGIHHDADDELVAASRAAIEERLGRPCDDGSEDDVDVDAVLAFCLPDSA